MNPWGATEPYGDGPPRPNPRRAAEVGALVVIGAAVVSVIASSWPLFIGVLDGERPSAAKPGIARAIRGRGWAVAPPAKKRPQLLGPRLDRPHIPFDNPHVPTLPRLGRSDVVAGATARPRTVIQLLDRSDAEGRTVITVGPKETLMVVRELPPWVLLAVKRDGHLEFGWATRSQIEIDP